jgi:FtsP/CotA-like multicopper oxidase with cupredoxin domain
MRWALVALLVCVTVLAAGTGTTLAQDPNGQGPIKLPTPVLVREAAGEAPAAAAAVAAAVGPRNGLVCTTGTSPNPTFTLTTQTGYIVLPDGNVVYMWGWSTGQNPFQHPSPALCVNQGDAVTVVVHNTLPEPISIIFPGQDNVLADGVPVQPQFDGGGNLASLAQTAPTGGSVTYSFVAGRPGTFLYESGTNPLKQVNMGLFGALIVRPSDGANFAYNDASTQFNPEAEFLMLLSEIDPMLHSAVEQGVPYNTADYHERYWMINGRSFPDTMADNGATWLPNQPYGALIYIHPFNDVVGDPAYNPYPALVRYLNAGTEDTDYHPHGNHQRVIAQDANLLIGAANQDNSYEKFAVLVGPGQTWDMLFDWRDAENWDPATNPIPVVIPQLQNLVVGPWYSGSPYLGNTDTLPVGTWALNQCGEYYHISHSHQLQKITAWGMVLSGFITFTRIDPPLGPENLCP